MKSDCSHPKPEERRVVEFFGIPGTGKSYLSEKLLYTLNADNLRVSSTSARFEHLNTTPRILGKLRFILSVIWQNRYVNRIAWELLKFYKPCGFRARLKLIFNWLFVLALIRSETRKSDVVVLDQGIGQALWSTCFHCNNPPTGGATILLVNLIRNLHISKLEIFHIHADERIVKERIHARINGQSPLDMNPSLWSRAVKATNTTRMLLDQATMTCDFVAISDIENNG